MPDLSFTSSAGDRRKVRGGTFTVAISLGSLICALIWLCAAAINARRDIDDVKTSKLDKAVYDSAEVRRDEQGKAQSEKLDRAICLIQQIKQPAKDCPL